MTAATINKINAAIARHAIEVVKGNGYFFFADLEGAPTYNADKVASVYSNTLRCMSLEDWIAYVDQHLDMGNAELIAALEEVRWEISRINRAAGETVFNPTATQLLDRAIRQLEEKKGK